MLKFSKLTVVTIALISSVLVIGCSKNSSSTPSTTSTISKTSTTLTTISTNSALPSVQATTTPGLLGSTEIVSSTPPIPASHNLLSTTKPQQIATNSITATEQIKSFKFDMDLSMSFDIPLGTQAGTMTIKQTGTSSVNIPDKQMDMVMNMVIEIPNQAKQNVVGEIYFLDGWMYMKANVPGVGDQWTKMKLTDEMWAMQSQLSSMTDFLKAPVGLELVGDDNINGIDCYVIDINPDMGSLTNWIEGQTGQTGIDLNADDISNILQNFTIKEWIAKDSHLVIKQQIRVKIDTSSLQFDSSGSTTQMNMEMNVILTYYDYGKPVIVQLPPEALNAQETTLPQ